MSQVNGAQAIWQLTSGFFMTARVVQTACLLGVFDVLGRQPTTADALANALGADPQGLDTLLTACAAAGVLERSSTGLYRNAAAATALLQENAPVSLKPNVIGASRQYADWVQLPEAIRRPRSATRQPATGNASESYLDGVFSTSWPAAVEFAASHDFGQLRTILDLGGGTGAYAIALCQKWPAVHVSLLDQPSVLAAAQKSIASAGLADRITVQSGDYFAQSAGAEYDLVLLMNVLHQETANDAQHLVKVAAGALARQGRLAIQDICLNPHRTGPVMAALLGVNLFLHSVGAVHGITELRSWLLELGLDVVHVEQHEITGSATIIARGPERP